MSIDELKIITNNKWKEKAQGYYRISDLMKRSERGRGRIDSRIIEHRSTYS